MSTNTPNTEDVDTPAPQPFSQWLFAQRNGTTHAELTDGLAALAEAVMETGKSGSLTLQIKVGKASKNGGHQMIVSDVVVVKAPTPARSESIFFYDEKTSSLTRQDPLQPQLPLQEVPKPANTTLKEAR
jgi:hypothetical protein